MVRLRPEFDSPGRLQRAPLAQSVEQPSRKGQVGGSRPPGGSRPATAALSGAGLCTGAHPGRPRLHGKVARVRLKAPGC
jgi:hypothetical protein